METPRFFPREYRERETWISELIELVLQGGTPPNGFVNSLPRDALPTALTAAVAVLGHRNDGEYYYPLSPDLQKALRETPLQGTYLRDTFPSPKFIYVALPNSGLELFASRTQGFVPLLGVMIYFGGALRSFTDVPRPGFPVPVESGGDIPLLNFFFWGSRSKEEPDATFFLDLPMEGVASFDRLEARVLQRIQFRKFNHPENFIGPTWSFLPEVGAGEHEPTEWARIGESLTVATRLAVNFLILRAQHLDSFLMDARGANATEEAHRLMKVHDRRKSTKKRAKAYAKIQRLFLQGAEMTFDETFPLGNRWVSSRVDPTATYVLLEKSSQRIEDLRKEMAASMGSKDRAKALSSIMEEEARRVELESRLEEERKSWDDPLKWKYVAP